MQNKRLLRIALLKAKTTRYAESEDGFGKYEDGYNGSGIEEIIAAANTYSPDILVAPEFMLYDGERVVTEDEKRCIEDTIAGEINRKDMLVLPGTMLWRRNGALRNTLPAIAYGRVVAEHQKATDGGCEEIAKKHGLKYVMGPKKGAVFRWKGLDIGMEICLDHLFEVLKKRSEQVDIHIVSASGIYYYPENDCTRPGGCFILCDGFGIDRNIVMQKGWAHVAAQVLPVSEERDANIYSIEIGGLK